MYINELCIGLVLTDMGIAVFRLIRCWGNLTSHLLCQITLHA